MFDPCVVLYIFITIFLTLPFARSMSNPTTSLALSTKVTDKANWDSIQTKRFLNLCLEQVKEGRRPGSHFTKKDWLKIQSGFVDKTGKRYDQPQLKNKWDNIKKDYKLWRKL